MSVHRLRLALGILFLLLAAMIFSRKWLTPGLDAQFNSLRMDLGGVLALVFGFLNIARWYAVWSYRQARATPVRTPFQRDPSVPPLDEPNPELDFTKNDANSPESPRRGDG